MPNPAQLRGFTLLQLLSALLILSLLTLAAYPAYRHHIRAAKLRAAQQALLADTHFLEQFYLQNGSFKANSTTWPKLPHTATDSFCIGLHGQAKGALDNEFTVKAAAFSPEHEPRILKINESLITLVCERSESRCTDEGISNGKDEQCTVYQP
ncbi:type IV pilin protein [Neisseria lisongii]|uniref:Pilin n=1 Tax=Neisseria lisongii TaxID=2912188 RepID=A0AAW5AHV1_9NEIS|nr:type IV pilin protein [Neisseria lisongii]MCF7529387.1 pilin [Neisseria lisongii]